MRWRPRQGRREHHPANSPYYSLLRLPSLGGYGDGVLPQGAIPGRPYLSGGHGHPLGVGLSLFQALLHALPLYTRYYLEVSASLAFTAAGSSTAEAGTSSQVTESM